MISIELVDRLIDRVIQLVNYKKAHDRAFLDNHITPTFEAVSALHEAYLASFKDYLAVVDTCTESLQSLIDRVETEKIFEDHARQRILAAISSLPDVSCAEFVSQVRRYLIYPSDLDGSRTAAVVRERHGPPQYIDPQVQQQMRQQQQQRYRTTLLNELNLLEYTAEVLGYSGLRHLCTKWFANLLLATGQANKKQRNAN